MSEYKSPIDIFCFAKTEDITEADCANVVNTMQAPTDTFESLRLKYLANAYLDCPAKINKHDIAPSGTSAYSTLYKKRQDDIGKKNTIEIIKMPKTYEESCAWLEHFLVARNIAAAYAIRSQMDVPKCYNRLVTMVDFYTDTLKLRSMEGEVFHEMMNNIVAYYEKVIARDPLVHFVDSDPQKIKEILLYMMRSVRLFYVMNFIHVPLDADKFPIEKYMEKYYDFTHRNAEQHELAQMYFSVYKGDYSTYIPMHMKLLRTDRLKASLEDILNLWDGEWDDLITIIHENFDLVLASTRTRAGCVGMCNVLEGLRKVEDTYAVKLLVDRLAVATSGRISNAIFDKCKFLVKICNDTKMEECPICMEPAKAGITYLTECTTCRNVICYKCTRSLRKPICPICQTVIEKIAVPGYIKLSVTDFKHELFQRFHPDSPSDPQ